jgi:hypothetical protein
MAQLKRTRSQARVTFASGKGLVETQPVRENVTQSRTSMAKWVGPADDVLRYSRRKPRLAFGAGALASAYVFGLGVWLQVTHGSDADKAAGMMAVGGVLTLGMLFFFARMSSYTFDRKTGNFGKTGWFAGKRRPLQDIIAVQLITYHHVLPKFETNRNYSTYQLNLVLDSAEATRANLATTGDLDSIRSGGQKLATFLGVPLLDQIEMTINNFL